MKKYRIDINSRRGHYYVSYHDGISRHNDGSEFWGLHIVHNKVELNKYIKKLVSEGYVEKGFEWA